MYSLKICTALSANLLDMGWYGAYVTCVNPFLVITCHKFFDLLLNKILGIVGHKYLWGTMCAEVS